MYNKNCNKTNKYLMPNEQHCQYCGKLCKNLNSLKQHEIRCSKNPVGNPHNGAIPGKCNIPLERRGWSRGLTKETDIRLQHTSEGIKKHIQDVDNNWGSHPHTAETKAKISEKMLGNKNWQNSLGKSGFGKKGWYAGIHCDSTYELAFVIYCLDHNIEIKRSTQVFQYQYNNKLHKYHPDFEIGDCLIEIKGYWKQQVDAKLQAVINAGKKIKIYYPEDLLDIFDYIYKKYGLHPGSELTALYDKI